LPKNQSFSEGSIYDARICTPAELGIHLVSRGDLTPVWCIVCRQAEYYMMDGLSSGFFPAGKVLDYRNTHDSRQGAMVEIMADSPGGIPTTPFLVSQTNLILFAGDYRGLAPQQLQEMKTRYGQTGTNLDPSGGALPPGVRLVLRGDQSPAWGIFRQQANRYRMDGSWAGVAESATVVDCQKTVSTSRGPAVDCLLHSTNSAPPSHALVAWEDLHLFTGVYKSLSEKQRIDLRNYYELTGKILSRKNELLKKAAEKNPHQAAYQASYRALLALVEKTQAEVIRRDHSADAEKVRAQERLFRIRMEERRLRNDYETAASKFNGWEKAHAAELNLPDNDSAITQWEKQKRPYQLMSSLAGLIY